MKEFDNLESFLDHVSLATSIDQDWGEKINMMTMHAQKVWSLILFTRMGGRFVSSSKIDRGKRA